MSAVLDRLLHRAAAITKPYNTRDAVLLINALAALRMNRKEVRTVCEKACFSLASSPEEVDAPVAVDIVNHLAKLQCAHLPVVRKVLLQRFCELSAHQQREGTRRSPLDPRTAQKAALALIKVGRTASSQAAVEHVLRLLHEMLRHHARDPGLRLAYVALYPYSSRFTQKPSWWSSIPPHKPSVSTLAASLRFLLEDSKAYRRASGNVAWQLLHALLVLPPLSHHDENVCEVPVALVSDFEAYCESGGLAHVTSIGAYAEFLQTFATDAARHSPQLISTLLRGLFVAEAGNLNSVSAATREQKPPKSTSRLRPMNIYDATKVAGAISQVLPILAAFTRGDSHPLGTQHSDTVADADDDDVDFLLSAPEQERDSSADTAQEAVRSAMNALAELVDSLQAGKLKTVRADDDAPPDTLLSASLLHAYAKSTLCRSAAPCVGDTLGVLLGLLPRITNAMPSQLSWMLVSLATLSSNSATGSSGRYGAALMSNAGLLLRRYVGVGAVKQRSLRTDVEMLYSCSRFAAHAACRCTGSCPASLRSHSKTAVSSDGDREVKGEDDEKVEEVSGESAKLTASPLVFSKEDMVKLMGEVTRRLMVAQAARAPAPHKEDVDMLLVALLDLHSAFSAAEAQWSSRSSGDAAQEKNAFAVALTTLQRVLLKCWEGSQEVAAEEGWEGLVLRTVRLHVLAACSANAAFSSDKEAADGLMLLYLSHLQVIEHSTAEVDSSMMLRCLAQLQLYPSAAADAEARPLLRLLCGKYQRYITQCAHATEVGAETVGQIVRVLRRARQAGVCVVFGCSAASEGEASQAAVQPTLRFPLVLTRPESVSAHTAADLLQLIVDAGLPHTGAGDDLSLRVASELTASLVARLREVPNVSCIVRVLHLTRTQRTASLLFPSSAGVTELLWCVEAHVAYCLKSTGERTEGASEVRRRAQNASRLLAAVLSSQLLLTLTFSTLKEVGNLQTDLLRLADYVETGGRRADEAAVLKARLLCGGIA